MFFKYLIHVLRVIPFVPLLLIQAKRVKRNIPSLPDAVEPEGLEDIGAEKTLRVLVLGESTVAGIGVEKHKDGLTGNIAKGLSKKLNVNVSWKAYGRSGYTAKRICTETVPEMIPEKVDFIAIALGGNDAFELNTPWGWKRDARKLVDALNEKFPDAKIAFTHLPPIKEFTAFTPRMQWAIGTLVEMFGELLHKEIDHMPNANYQHQIVGLSSWREQAGQELPPEAFFSDGVHPSQLNFELWGADFSGWVVKEKILEG